jgi:F-type H+-transporting ATPase subunit a
MLAGHTLVAVILGFTAVLTKDFVVAGGAITLVSVAGVTALTFLELLVALIQAFVFTFLTTVYLAGAVHPEH